MNNNVLFNLISNLTNSNFQNNNNSSIQANQAQHTTNTSEYPDVFFSNTKMQSTIQTMQQSQNNIPQNNILNGNSLLNQNSIFQLLPLLFNSKGNNANMNKLIENINPQLSQIMSVFSNTKKDKKNDSQKNAEPKVIDISDFKEIN